MLLSSNIKRNFLESMATRFGHLKKMGKSQSLYQLQDRSVRIYIRYSKVHNRGSCFYGLRQEDLRELEGHRSFICFLWDNQREPLIIPFTDYEDVFQSVSPAGDGQYKVQLFFQNEGTELYIATAGRFNVDAYFGWEEMHRQIEVLKAEVPLSFSHHQIQTFLGAIGSAKDCDIWIPQNDRGLLDWSLVRPFSIRSALPSGSERTESILREIDVVWIERGGNRLRALYEVEHSTLIYSGLLRFNDIHLSLPSAVRFAIVSDEKRRSVFSRQINRPTFRTSGLSELCTFLEYTNVFRWYQRLFGEKQGGLHHE